MLTVSLAFFIGAATAGFDVDDVGLSALERSAIVERARAELGDEEKGVELVDAPGLASCTEGSTDATGVAPALDLIACAKDALTSAGAVAGAAIRVVKVLQVVRVDLVVLDREGLAVMTSTRTLDVEGAAKGPLFDEAARTALVQLAPRARTAEPTKTEERRKPSAEPSTPTASGTMTFAAVGAGAVGVVIALAGSALATNEALLANSPSSSGDEKERARILGPIATATAVLGVGFAVAAPVMLLSIE